MSFDEFQLEFIPLDEDILTLELPVFFKDYFLVSKCILLNSWLLLYSGTSI